MIPGADSPQGWDRFAYTENNPIRYNDPSGHCVTDPFTALLCAMAIGAAIGVVVDVVHQYNEHGTLADLNWKEIGVAAGVGAVAGGVGAVIAPVAAMAGVSMTAATGSALIGTATELSLGGFMAGTSNVILNNSQRIGTDWARGQKVTLKGIDNDFHENLWSDMKYGAVGFGVGKAFSSIGEEFWRPSTSIENPPVFGNPILSAPKSGVNNLLDPHPAQQIITGSASALAHALSNSNLLETYFHKRNQFIAQ